MKLIYSWPVCVERHTRLFEEYFRKICPISIYSTIDLQTARYNKYQIIPKVGIHFYKANLFNHLLIKFNLKRLEGIEQNDSVKSMRY